MSVAVADEYGVATFPRGELIGEDIAQAIEKRIGLPGHLHVEILFVQGAEDHTAVFFRKGLRASNE